MAFIDFTDEELTNAINERQIGCEKANVKKVSLVAGFDSYYMQGQDGSYQLLHLSDYDSAGYKTAVAYVDKLQNAKSNVTLDVTPNEAYGGDPAFDIREWEYKTLYYLEVTFIYSNKTYIVLSSVLRDFVFERFGNYEIGTPQIFETSAKIDEAALIDTIKNSDDIISLLVNKIGNNDNFASNIANNISIKADFKEAITNSVTNSIINSNAFLEQIAIKVIEYMHLNGVDFTYAPTLAKVTLIHENGVVENVDLMEKENGIWQGSTTLNGAFTIQISPKGGLL